MRPPFFFFNADTDCPHYLLGWVREPGMALEPSPERRSSMNTQTHRTCIRMSQEEYDLLKEKLNIAKITFTSGVNAGSAEFDTKNDIERCPLCGISLNEEGVCPKCGYKKQ